jgi:outer membrane protein assembly factor BamB
MYLCPNLAYNQHIPFSPFTLPPTTMYKLHPWFRIGFACCIALCIVTVFATAYIEAQERKTSAEQWNQYRGPQGNGISQNQALPTTWSETEHVKWKTPIRGKAWSSPVIWNNQIWLTTAPPDGKELFALSVNLETGKIEHDVKVFSIANPHFCIERNSYASCTPVVEEGRVYVHFGSHGTACLDTKSGAILWQRQDLECDHHRGAASSPIVWNDMLILTFDGFNVQYVTALDKKTGKTLWRTDRNFEYGTDNGDVKKAYSTPHVAMVNGKPQLISASAGASAGYDPYTGKEIWRVKNGGMNAACRPVLSNDLAILCTADGGFSMFAVKLGATGDIQGDIAWKLAKGAPRYSSPILVDDLLYMGSEKGTITCAEASTGNVVWQERLGGLFMPSPIYGADKLYFFNEEGKCSVLAPGRELKVLATNTLDDGIMASPAVAGKALIVRGKTALYRLEE